MFSFGETDKQLSAVLKKYNRKIPDCLRGLPETIMARYVLDHGNVSIIRMKVIPETNKDYGSLQHELFHAVTIILQQVGMTLSEDSDEAYAHMLGYLTELVYDKISESK